MPDDVKTPEGWGRHERPPTLFRRFTFGGYNETRAFMDQLGTLSEQTGRYPDISFGTTYANVTIHAQDGEPIGSEDMDFAQRVNQLFSSVPHT